MQLSASITSLAPAAAAHGVTDAAAVCLGLQVRRVPRTLCDPGAEAAAGLGDDYGEPSTLLGAAQLCIGSCQWPVLHVSAQRLAGMTQTHTTAV